MSDRAGIASPFHAGERAVQELLGVRAGIEPWARKAVRPVLPPEHRAFYAQLPFLVVAARDGEGRPWATLLAGAPGFAHSPEPETLRIGSTPGAGDPLHTAFAPGADVGLLGIDLATRRRNRVNGRVSGTGAGEFAIAVDQSFGNCPQYIVERAWRRAARRKTAPPVERRDRLSPALAARIRRADTLFIATGHRGDGESESFGMDASHRGGAPGFVRVEDQRTLVIPDYAGNNHFNTVGNLVVEPRAGLLFVDFERGGLLQLTGTTEIDWDSPVIADHPGARRLIRFRAEEVVVQPDALSIRWRAAAARLLRLVAKQRESEDVVSFTFEPRDGGALPRFAAGQHLPVVLDVPGQPAPVERTYSLSNAPGDPRYRISVKREPHGIASRHLHHTLRVGAVLAARDPAGDFTLAHTDRPVFLVSAGIGVTPMLSMLGELVAGGDPREVWFVHGARDGDHHPLAREAADLAARSDRVTAHVAYSRPRREDAGAFDTRGRVDAALLATLRPQLDADYYLCGPPAFMAQIQGGLEALDVSPERVHTESFGPAG